MVRAEARKEARTLESKKAKEQYCTKAKARKHERKFDYADFVENHLEASSGLHLASCYHYAKLVTTKGDAEFTNVYDH